jgi:hypothetical protein
MWELKNGKIPEGMIVCHKCDNPPCVNPDHLFLGTVQDNAKDMMNKGRGRGQFVPGHTGFRNETNFKPKLTASLIARIRDLVLGGISQNEVARHYNLSKATVSRVVSGYKPKTLPGSDT